MSRRQWALAAVLLLVNYIIFASLATTVLGRPVAILQATRTPLPTFTLPPSATPDIVQPTDTSAAPPAPTATPTTPTPTPGPPTVQPSPTPAVNLAAVTVEVNLNVRAGPGTNYPRVGSLAPGSTVPIVGRNADGSWWQITFEDVPGGKAWISAGYGTARNADNVPVVEVSPPAPTVAPAVPTVAAAAEGPAL